MDRNDEGRVSRTRRSRMDSNEDMNNTTSIPTGEGEPRRRRSQAARIREDTMSMESVVVPEDTITPRPTRETARTAPPPPPPPPSPRGRSAARDVDKRDVRTIEDFEDTLTKGPDTLDARRRYGRPDAKQQAPAKASRYDDDGYDDGFDDYDAYEEPISKKKDKKAKKAKRGQEDAYEDTRGFGKTAEYDDFDDEYDDAPRGRKQKNARYDDEDDYYDDEEDEEFDGAKRKRRIIRWVVIIGVILALLAGVTLVGLNNPDLIEPVVQWGRELFSGATPTPEPTAEPTPEPIITPEPAPDISAAVVVTLTAEPYEQPDINMPVTFVVITSMQTDRVRIVNDNGETLIEGIEGDYTDIPDVGRQWQLMVYFITPYEGSIEAYPGNESGWNEANGSRIQITVGDTSATTVATGEGLGTLQANAGTAAELVERAGQAIDKTGAIDDFSRTKDISLGDATGYVGSNGMNGVLTFRGSSLRQNGAFGTVSPTEMKLEEIWSAESGMAGTSESAFGSQPLIVQWHANIRELMAMTADKVGKSQLKEVIFAGNNGKLYFYDLDDGIATRTPIEGEKEVIPMFGTPSVYPMGIPLLAVGTGDPSVSSTSSNTGLMMVNMIKNADIGTLSGRNDDALSTNGTIITSPLIDNGSDTVLSAGGNGLLYTMGLSTSMDSAENTITIKPDVSLFRAGSEGEDATVDSSMAGYGDFVYYTTNGGVLTCVNINTFKVVWALNVGADTDAAVALDTSSGTMLYHATKSDVDGLAHMRKIDATDGTVLWDMSVPGSIAASPLVGTGELSNMVFFAATNSEAGGTVYALDASNGSLLWEYVVVGSKLSSPVALYGENGGAWIVQGDEGGLLLLDAQNGDRMDYLVLDGGVYGSPAAFNDIIVVATDAGKLHGVRIK